MQRTGALALLCACSLALLTASFPGGGAPTSVLTDDLDRSAGVGAYSDSSQIPVFKFGTNFDADAAEDVWDGDGFYVWRADNSWGTLNVLSSSDVDSLTNPGATSIVIEGLDSLYAIQRDTVAIEGTDGVATTTQWTRVYRAWVDAAGDSTYNVGAISVKTATGDTTLALITATYGQTLMTQYTIPAGYTGNLYQFQAFAGGAVGATAKGHFQLMIRKFGTGSWRTMDFIGFSGGSPPPIYHEFPSAFPAKTDICVRIVPGQANTIASAQFTLLLRKD